jgi:hypothetical protein
MKWYEILCQGMIISIPIWNFVPRYDILYQGMKISSILVWNFEPRYEMLYPSVRFFTQVWNLAPRYGFCLCLTIKIYFTIRYFLKMRNLRRNLGMILPTYLAAKLLVRKRPLGLCWWPAVPVDCFRLTASMSRRNCPDMFDLFVYMFLEYHT